MTFWTFKGDVTMRIAAEYYNSASLKKSDGLLISTDMTDLVLGILFLIY